MPRCYRFTSWPPFMCIVLAWRLASNTSVPTSIQCGTNNVRQHPMETCLTTGPLQLAKFQLTTNCIHHHTVIYGHRARYLTWVWGTNQKTESLLVQGPDMFGVITIAVLLITASVRHLGRCPGRLLAAAQSHQLSCVFVARCSVTDEENLKATNYCWHVSDTGGFIPNKDAGHLFGGFFLWVYGWTCSAICADTRLNALSENEPVQNELRSERLHQHSFADESDFQEAAPLHAFQHQYKEGFCLT